MSALRNTCFDGVGCWCFVPPFISGLWPLDGPISKAADLGQSVQPQIDTHADHERIDPGTVTLQSNVPAGESPGALSSDIPLPRGAEGRRLRKEQSKDARREFVRQQRREKKKARQDRRREGWHELLNSMEQDEREIFVETRKREVTQLRVDRQESLQRAYDSGKPKVVINCSFCDDLSHTERTSLAKQSQMAYIAVRDLMSPIQLHLTSLGPENQAMPAFETIGLRGWTIHIHEESVWELFDVKRIVVLTPDADEDLEGVDEDSIYVLGGIVDRSVKKRMSLEQAQDKGAMCVRRLPLKKYGPRGAFPVLNIDTTVIILAEWLKRGGDWPGVLAECLKNRHNGKPSAKTIRRKRRGEMQEGQPPGSDDDISTAESVVSSCGNNQQRKHEVPPHSIDCKRHCIPPDGEAIIDQ